MARVNKASRFLAFQGDSRGQLKGHQMSGPEEPEDSFEHACFLKLFLAAWMLIARRSRRSTLGRPNKEEA